MKKQSFGIILAAVLGAGSLSVQLFQARDALFTTALPGTGAVSFWYRPKLPTAWRIRQ